MKIITKICISIFSLIFFMALLEGGLRTARYFYFKKVVPLAQISDDAQKSHKILSMGDSYTVGGSGMWKNSYPVQLQGMLPSGPNKKFTVINGGICESNSAQVLTYLSELMKANKIDYVILLVGATNGFNFADYNLREKGRKDIISNLQIYKMFRILRTNLKGELLKLRSRHQIAAHFPWDAAYFPSARSHFENGRWEEAEKIYKKAIESDPDQDWAYFELGMLYKRTERWEEAEKILRKMLEVHPAYQEAYFLLGECYRRQGRLKEEEEMYKKAIDINPTLRAYAKLGELYIAQGRYDRVVESLCRALELHAEEPWSWPHASSLYSLSRAYALQSKYDSDYVLEAFERIIKKNPGLKKNEEFMDYVDFFKDKGEWEQKIERWLRRDLEEIVKLCHRSGIKLIIQNYPYPFTLANKALRDVASRHSIPFVDNRSVFDALVAKHGRERYFLDDDHCTIEGHKVMARNVYNVLVAEGIVPENGEVGKDEKVAF